MNILKEGSAGAKQAISVKNIVYMTIITVIVTLILSRILKNEIILYDVHGKVTGYGDIKPSLKTHFEPEEKKK